MNIKGSFLLESFQAGESVALWQDPEQIRNQEMARLVLNHTKISEQRNGMERINIDEPYLNNPTMILLAERMAERIQNQETDPAVERNLCMITSEKIV